MITTTIAPADADGRHLVTVALPDGTTDTIEAHDFEAAIRFSHHHLAVNSPRVLWLAEMYGLA